MNYKIIFILLFLNQAGVFGQTADSLSRVAELDTLSANSKIQFDNFQLESALQGVASLKMKTLEYFGKTHPAYIEACILEANVYWRKGDYENAIHSSNEGIALQLSEYGKNNDTYSGLLHIRGTILMEMAKYSDAKTDLQECLVIREQVSGKESAKYAMTLNNLANVYTSTGDFDQSLSLHLQAKDIREKVLGKKSLDYAMSLANLGRTAFQTAQYEKSLTFLDEAKNIAEEIHGKQHPIIAFATHNSAIAYLQTGQYEKAEVTFREALQLIEKAQGKGHPAYSFVLNDLGVMYDNLGLADQALAAFSQSLEIKEKTLGKQHNYTLATLGNLAKSYQEKGDLQRADSLYREVANTYAQLYGKGHYENLMVLNNLANVYFEKHELEKADSLHREVLLLRQKELGNKHPDCAMSMMGIAKIFETRGEINAAISVFENASLIFNGAFGKTNLNSIKCYQDLAEAHWKIKNNDLAIAYIDSLDEAMQAHLLRSARHLSSNELQLTLSASAPRQDFIHAARMQLAPKAPQIVGATYNHALLYKGMLLENAMGLEKSMASAPDSIYETYLDWKGLQRRFAQNYSLPPGNRQDLTDLENKAEQLEKALLKFTSFRSFNEKANWKKVQKALKPGELAIEFLHFNGFDPAPADSIYYTAILIRPEWDYPRWIKLFRENDLLPFISGSTQRKSDYVETLFAEKQSQSLYSLVWRPLESFLEGISKIVYSPSGILHRIPLAALQNNRGQHLGDLYDLQLVGSTRQVLNNKQTEEESELTISIFGGIQFDMDSSAISSAGVLANLAKDENNNLYSEVSRSLARTNSSWTFLPWTEVEAKMLEQLFQTRNQPVDLFTGYEASEACFKDLGASEPGSRVIHLATHGYFFPDPANRTEENHRQQFQLSEHPMIRSGLIMAGANYAWDGGKRFKDLEDGILTAYEVSQLDLSGTELVVLSACETGLGEIKGNEGVYGLQRAFKIAGVRYVLMSLWQVPDFATQELMIAFYENWLEYKMTIPAAFRAAQQEIRKKRPEAYYWAGFVLLE